MTFENLKSPKFAPLGAEKAQLVKGGNYEHYSTKGTSTVRGKEVEFANDCITQRDDGTFHVVYTLPDGTAIIWDSDEKK